MVFLYYVFTANLAMLSTGLSVGWASSTVPKMLNGQETIRMTDAQLLWMDPLMLLGVVLGCTVSGLLINRIGRKMTLLLTAPTYILSSVLITIAESPMEIMCSRVVSGFGSGLCFCSTAIYLSEIASVRARGAVCGTQLLFYEVGFLLSNIAALFLELKIHALVSAIIPLAFMILFINAPESPYYLMLRGNYDMAQKALAKCRGKKDVEDEMRMITGTIKHDLVCGRSLLDLFTIRSNVKSLTIVLCIAFARNLAGRTNIHHYATIIFNDVFPQFDEKYLPIIFGVLKVCNSLVIISLVDHSRKLLILISTTIAGISTFIIASYYLFRETSANMATFGVVIVVVEIVFTLFFTLYRLSFILAGELFTISMKAYGVAILTVGSQSSYYGTVYLYQLFSSSAPIYASFFTISIIDFISAFAIHYCNLPETGQKTFMEIQQLLKQTDDCEETYSRASTLSAR